MAMVARLKRMDIAAFSILVSDGMSRNTAMAYMAMSGMAACGRRRIHSAYKRMPIRPANASPSMASRGMCTVTICAALASL